MIFIKEVYKWGVPHDVIEEYKQCVKKGLIKEHNPFEYDPSEDDSNPIWEIVELTEEELRERIAEARKLEEKWDREHKEFLKAAAEGRASFGPPSQKDYGYIFG